jgi:flavodoxin
MRILLIYASRIGSSKKLAQSIANGCRTAGIEPEIRDLLDSFKLFDYLHFLPIPKSKAMPGIVQDLSTYDLIFLGFEIHNYSSSSKLMEFIDNNDFNGKKIALFCTYYINKKYLHKIEEKFRMKNADIFNTISLKRKGLNTFFGFGNLEENDLVRAEAFAERSINNLLGRKITKENEKQQIKGYRK